MKQEIPAAPVRPSRSVLPSNEFSAILVHEIANPLTGMFTVVQILERHLYGKMECLDKTTADLLRNLSDEINRLKVLLDELRSHRVLAPLDLHPTSLSTEIEDLLALEAAQYARRAIRIERDIPADLPPVMADRGKLRQVLLNLCKNAVDAMPNGGTLSFRCYKDATQVCFEIADTGEGLPEGMRLFEPFVTNKPGGAGLGLAIVQEIVRQHNGTISYASQPRKGTLFCIHLPLVAAG